MSAPDRPDTLAHDDEPDRQAGRREFLKLSASAGVAAAASTASCHATRPLSTAGALLNKRPLSERELKRFLGRLDAGLAEIATGAPAREALPKAARSKAFLASIATEDGAIRKALRALYFTAMYGELPEESRNHPEVQRRLRQLTPEIDEAVFTMTGALNALSKDESAGLRKYLKAHPRFGDEVAELIGGRAGRVGLPVGRRMQLRRNVLDLTWRLHAQPPSLLVGEYVGKVRKVAARQGQTEELARYLATHSSSAAFWEAQRRVAALERPDAAGEEKKPKPAPLEKEKKSGPGQPLVNAGLILLGLTVASGLVGGLLVGYGIFGGAFVLTAGAALLIAGIVVLIVGAVRNAEESD